MSPRVIFVLGVSIMAGSAANPVPSPYELKLHHKERRDEVGGAYGRAHRCTWVKPAGVATFFDITNRNRAEEKLSYLATYPVLNPNPIIEVNIAGAINYLNPVASQLFPDITTMELRHPMLEGLEEIICEDH